MKVYDLGISDEHAYMVMEYFAAGDLRRRMRLPLRVSEARPCRSRRPSHSDWLRCTPRGVLHRT
ncbi:MAG: hypothetical protein WDM77_14120 [Steroidobacteraceae bacterium]